MTPDLTTKNKYSLKNHISDELWSGDVLLILTELEKGNVMIFKNDEIFD